MIAIASGGVFALGTNDDLANAIDISGALPFTDMQNTVGATLEGGEPTPSCVLSDNSSVWYKITPETDMTLHLDTVASNYDTVLSVWADADGVYPLDMEVACNDDLGIGDLQSSLDVALLADTDYYIRITEFGTTAEPGDLVFNASQVNTLTPPVAVDDMASTNEDTPVVIDVAANDFDVDGNLDPASAMNTTDPVNGTLFNHGDGTFTYTPGVNFFGADEFNYTICDEDLLCSDMATVSIDVVAVNDPPDCSAAGPSVDTLWAPNHQMVDVQILGVTDPEDDPISITIDDITVDDAEGGSGNTADDVGGIGTDTAQVRAERSGRGGGRTYHIAYTASDGDLTCDGTADVNVPHDQGNNNNNNAQNNPPQNPGNSGNNPPQNPGNSGNNPPPHAHNNGNGKSDG
jgi:hypothetical protein